MRTLRLTRSLVLSLLILTVFTACQYQPSSLARTEIPLFIPPARSTPPAEPPSTLPTVEIHPSSTAPANTPTPTLETKQYLDCQLATDSDYGFSPDNPIQVGSNQLSDGPEREVIYLLTLRGPNGEEVFYTRQSPEFNQAGTIVDPYLVEFDGIKEPLTLYFDLYNYAALLVPAGFTCEAPFPIQPPQE